MSLMRTLVTSTALFSTQLLLADPGQEALKANKPQQPKEEKSNFHAIVASGYAWSMEADIDGLTDTDWALSNNGYDGSLGNSPYIMLGFGYTFWSILDVDFGYTLYDTFHYQKNQTDPFGDKRTRFFDLTHQSSLFNFSIFPYGFNLCKVKVTPYIGMGIGVGTSTVSNFQTVFYDPLDGIGLTTSIGDPNTRNSFAWQGTGGFRIQPNASKLSLDIAYRYYNGGTFESSSSIKDYDGIGDGDTVSVEPWTATFQTNQLYFAINFAI
jgi:hypothetical protein